MKQKGYSYINGSTARQLEYDIYEQNKVLKTKKKYKNNRKAKLRVILSVLLLFMGGLFIMYRYAAITQLSNNINQIEKQYYSMRNENARLRVQIEQDTDLTGIKEIAETRLAMQKPDKSQIIYIQVPKNDFTVVMNSSEKPNGFIDKLTGLMSLLD